MAGGYPKRDQFFAHRFTRLVFKSCAIQRLGHHAALLVIHIAHTEDAARYSGPVTFWNSQLSETLGFTSPKQLANARAVAIDLGWLHYERHGTRSVGNYWVTIPPGATRFDDQPIEEPLAILSPGGTNPVPILSQLGTNCGMNPGKNCGKLPNPVPVPVLNCTELNWAEAGLGEKPADPRADEPIQPLPLGRIKPSAVYQGLTAKHLTSARSMVEWFRRQLSASKPVLPATRESLLLVLCAASRASEPGVGNSVGKFVRLVQEARWAEVERYRAEAVAAIEGPLRQAVSAPAERPTEAPGEARAGKAVAS